MAINENGILVERQYIGARYVVKVYENSADAGSAEWEANTNYEPLTLVTYNYGSYLSKKNVPATVGNPASNSEYWVQTGFYNGQIASLQDQIDTINNTTIPGLSDEIDGVAGSVTELSGDVDDLKADILTELVIIGDSYSADQYTVSQNIKAWWEYVAEQENLTPHNFATSMMGFIATETYPTNYEAQINLADADTSFNNNKVKLVVIQGSINDFTHETGTPDEIFTKCDTTIKLARTKFPKAKIVLFMGNTFGSYPAPITIGGTTYHYYDYIEQINQASSVNGVECLCDQYYWIFDHFMFLNGIGGHPGAYGQRSMATFFISNGVASARCKPLTFADAPNLYIRRMGYNRYALLGSYNSGATFPLTLPNQLEFQHGVIAATIGAISGTQAAIVGIVNDTLQNYNNVPFTVRTYFDVSNYTP